MIIPMTYPSTLFSMFISQFRLIESYWTISTPSGSMKCIVYDFSCSTTSSSNSKLRYTQTYIYIIIILLLYIYMIYGWCLQDRDLFVFDDVAGKDGHSRPASYKVISTSSETCQTQGPLDFCAQTFPRSHSLCGKQMDLHSPLVKLVKSQKSSWLNPHESPIWYFRFETHVGYPLVN